MTSRLNQSLMDFSGENNKQDIFAYENFVEDTFCIDKHVSIRRENKITVEYVKICWNDVYFETKENFKKDFRSL